MICYRNDFLKQQTKCLELLPDDNSRHLFMCALLGAMAPHLDQETVEECIGIALDISQTIRKPFLINA